MLTKPHYERTLTKLRRFEDMLNPYLYYAGHDCPGCMPFDEDTRDYQYSFDDLIVCTKDALINQFYFDLKTVNQLAAERTAV